jgi:hypothetical protein
VRLHDLPLFLDVFLEHIGRRKEKKRPKQIELFRAQLCPQLSAASADALGRALLQAA